MFIHFLKHTFRLFTRNRMYSFINLMGLSVGLTVGILILMIVGNQLSYDRFHKQGKDIYQVGIIAHSKDRSDASNTNTAAVAPSLHEAFPEVLSFVRVSAPVPGYFSRGEQTIMLEEISWADSTFFETFSFRLK
jgi:putative ABC transport system permease protein